MIQDHDFVDHGQLKMRVGVVHRDAAVFHQQQHKEHHRHEEQFGAAQQPFRAGASAQHTGEGQVVFQMQRPAHAGQGQQTAEEHRFGQRGKGGLAARAHTFKGGTRIQRREDDGKASQPQQVGGQQEIPLKGQRRGDAAQRQQGQRAERRGQGDRRAEREHEAGAAADDLALAQQLEDVEIKLEQGLAVPSGELGLDAVDDARQQRSQQQRQHELDKVGDERTHACIPQMSRATRVTRIYRM